MFHNLNGRWFLMSSDRLEDYMKCVGCSVEMINKMMPMLMATGERGHVEEYMVDMNHKAVRRCTYFNDKLIREYMVPLDMEVPGWALNGTFMRMKMSTDGTNRLIRTETGDNYTATACAEVDGDMCNVTWTCSNVTCTMRYKRMH